MDRIRQIAGFDLAVNNKPGAPANVTATAGNTEATVSLISCFERRQRHHFLHGDIGP